MAFLMHDDEPVRCASLHNTVVRHICIVLLSGVKIGSVVSSLQDMLVSLRLRSVFEVSHARGLIKRTSPSALVAQWLCSQDHALIRPFFCV